MSQSSSHCSSLRRSSCRMFASDRELIQRFMTVSSAKSLTLDLTCFGMSFMYAKNRMGPSAEPCGTPEETGIVLELVPLVTTVFYYLKSPLSILKRPPYAISMKILKKFFVGNFVESFTKF